MEGRGTDPDLPSCPRTSENPQKANFALTEFYEVRAEKQCLSNNKEDSPSGGCTQRV